MMRLPSGLRLTTDGSSQRKSTTSSGRESVTPDSRRTADDLQRAEHADDAVEPPAGLDGVGVRAEHEHGAAAVAEASDEVARRVDAGVEPGVAEAVREPDARLLVVARERAARVGQVRVGELGDASQVGVEAVAVYVEGRQVIGHVGSPFVIVGHCGTFRAIPLLRSGLRAGASHPASVRGHGATAKGARVTNHPHPPLMRGKASSTRASIRTFYAGRQGQGASQRRPYNSMTRLRVRFTLTRRCAATSPSRERWARQPERILRAKARDSAALRSA